MLVFTVVADCGLNGVGRLTEAKVGGQLGIGEASRSRQAVVGHAVAAVVARQRTRVFGLQSQFLSRFFFFSHKHLLSFLFTSIV